MTVLRVAVRRGASVLVLAYRYIYTIIYMWPLRMRELRLRLLTFLAKGTTVGA